MKKKKVTIINELKQKKAIVQKKEINEALLFVEKTIIPELLYYLEVGIRKRRFCLDNNWTNETLNKIEEYLKELGLESSIEIDIDNIKKLYVLVPIKTIENNSKSNNIDFSLWNKFETPVYHFIEDIVHNIVKPAIFKADSQNINNLIVEIPNILNNNVCLSIFLRILEENQIKVDFDILNNPNILQISWDSNEEKIKTTNFENVFSGVINFNNKKTKKHQDTYCLNTKLEIELNSLKKLLIDLKESLISLEKEYNRFLLLKGNNLFQMNFNYSIKRYFKSVDLLYRYLKPMADSLSDYIEKEDISDNINGNILKSIKELINNRQLNSLEKLCTELINIQEENKKIFISIIKRFSLADIKNNITDYCDYSYITKLYNYSNLKFNGMFFEGLIDEKILNAIDFFYKEFEKESIDCILKEKNINFSIKDSNNIEYNEPLKNIVNANSKKKDIDKEDVIDEYKDLVEDCFCGTSAALSHFILFLILMFVLFILNSISNLL